MILIIYGKIFLFNIKMKNIGLIWINMQEL